MYLNNIYAKKNDKNYNTCCNSYSLYTTQLYSIESNKTKIKNPYCLITSQTRQTADTFTLCIGLAI